MDIQIKKAVRKQKKLKLVLDGLAGSGKTYTALRLAFALGKNVCVIDTEHGRASLYAGEVVDGVRWDFSTIDLTCQSVGWYIDAIAAAVQSGADVVIVDSISPEWDSEEGILQVVERNTPKSGSSFSAWNEGGKQHKRFINAILAAPVHTICTMRTKSNYVLEPNERGKLVPRKVGLAPVQRDGIEYEFDLCMRMTSGTATVTKSPGFFIPADYSVIHPGKEFAQKILDWLNLSEPAQPEIQPAKPSTPAPVQEPKPEAPEEAPGIGPEMSPDEALKQVIEFLKAGKITKKDLETWAMMEPGFPLDMTTWKTLLTKDQKYRLYEAMEVCARTGAFVEPAPF